MLKLLAVSLCPLDVYKLLNKQLKNGLNHLEANELFVSLCPLDVLQFIYEAGE